MPEQIDKEPIGKVIATEKVPTTIDTFYFWTQLGNTILHPFDVIQVSHLKDSKTFGVSRRNFSYYRFGKLFVELYI